MSISVVYWSGTGNTQAMAEAILQKLQELDYISKN